MEEKDQILLAFSVTETQILESQVSAGFRNSSSMDPCNEVGITFLLHMRMLGVRFPIVGKLNQGSFP